MFLVPKIDPAISKRPVWIRNAKSATSGNVLAKNSPSSLPRDSNVHSPASVTDSNYDTDLYGTSSYLLDTHFAYNKLLESGNFSILTFNFLNSGPQ